MSEICALSDLPVDQCACRIHKPVEPAPEYDVAFRFPARFYSTLDCGHEAEPGDPIAKTMDDCYICEACAS
jgi:hypothetical protein